MEQTQYLIFEASPQCHLGRAHRWCPNTHPERYAASAGLAPLTDDRILELARQAHDLGFAGLIGWHYYNEPMCAWWRIRPLMERIRAAVPQARFVLWTNGAQMPTDRRELAGFEELNITDYANNRPRLPDLPGRVVWRPVVPDSRLQPGPARVHYAPCRRMHTEMVFDYFGRVHACCHDWRGAIDLGNGQTDAMPELLRRWRAMRAQVAGHCMGPDAPETCLRCGLRSGNITEFDQQAAARARAALAAGWPVDPSALAAFAVAVAYRIPEWRVRQFVDWNRAEFARRGIRTILVVEQPYPDLPPEIVQVVYPEPLPIFNLAATKNCGIRKAAELQPESIIVATDIDVALPGPTLDACLAVAWRQAAVPLYLMADEYDTRETRNIPAPRATGTVAMHAAHWRRLPYDNRCQGYGSDDAILLADLRHADLAILARDLPAYHMAHRPGTCQAEFKGRADHWGRDAGFNPENFAANGRLYQERGQA
jgi:hypothetical protein